MLFKIKDIPIGTTLGAYQFIEEMKRDPKCEYDSFSSMEEEFGVDWKDWWMQNRKSGGYVYHISWLEKYK